MKDDFDKWPKDRDARLKPEWVEEAQFEARIDKLNRNIYYAQSGPMLEAATSSKRVNETGGGKTTGSTHQLPQAFDYVMGLRDFMLGSRHQ
jgi:hypothetical protein